MNPTHPVYIISKGRWETPKTAQSLNKMGVPYRIVVEPQEAEAYAKALGEEKILVLPFSNLGQGSIPARNFVWEHSIEAGASWHWILDDNIRGFFRLHLNLKTPVADGTIFAAAEKFVDRYETVGQAGFNYFMFASRKTRIPPYYLNTRIYSCILNRNDLDFRWRGRYNEDTDLSLRILKAGWATVLFNAFLAYKETTMTMKGGNEDLYVGDGRLQMAQSLVDQHPDVTKITWRWGRHQHVVDYRPFRFNELRRKPGVERPLGPNNFGMVLQRIVDGWWTNPDGTKVEKATGTSGALLPPKPALSERGEGSDGSESRVAPGLRQRGTAVPPLVPRSESAAEIPEKVEAPEPQLPQVSQPEPIAAAPEIPEEVEPQGSQDDGFGSPEPEAIEVVATGIGPVDESEPPTTEELLGFTPINGYAPEYERLVCTGSCGETVRVYQVPRGHVDAASFVCGECLARVPAPA